MMSPLRHTVSTHLIRHTARRAQRHYERLQAAGFGEISLLAASACRQLGIGPHSKFDVERAHNERGKWRVVSTG